MKRLIGVMTIVLGFGVTGLAHAAITGSSHDFTDNLKGKSGNTDTLSGGVSNTVFVNEAWNQRNEICRVCHVPHDHGLATQRYTNGLLWNHGISTATYTMYDSTWSPTITGIQDAQPTGSSKLCLGCHDGTVAIDTFDKMPAARSGSTGKKGEKLDDRVGVTVYEAVDGAEVGLIRFDEEPQEQNHDVDIHKGQEKRHKGPSQWLRTVSQSDDKFNLHGRNPNGQRLITSHGNAGSARPSQRERRQGTMAKTHSHPGAPPGSISAKILVRLTPRCSRNEVAGGEGDEYRIRVTSPPVDGLANQALIDFLSKILKVGKGNILILAGKTSPLKRILVSGLSQEEVSGRLQQPITP